MNIRSYVFDQIQKRGGVPVERQVEVVTEIIERFNAEYGMDQETRETIQKLKVAVSNLKARISKLEKNWTKVKSFVSGKS